MSDSSMCVHYKCPRRMRCHRYTAVPDKEQQLHTIWCEAYDADGALIPIGSEECRWFWDNTGYTNDIRDEKIIRRDHEF